MRNASNVECAIRHAKSKSTFHKKYSNVEFIASLGNRPRQGKSQLKQEIQKKKQNIPPIKNRIIIKKPKYPAGDYLMSFGILYRKTHIGALLFITHSNRI
jgi:hypothetical protein